MLGESERQPNLGSKEGCVLGLMPLGASVLQPEKKTKKRKQILKTWPQPFYHTIIAYKETYSWHLAGKVITLVLFSREHNSFIVWLVRGAGGAPIRRAARAGGSLRREGVAFDVFPGPGQGPGLWEISMLEIFVSSPVKTVVWLPTLPFICTKHIKSTVQLSSARAPNQSTYWGLTLSTRLTASAGSDLCRLR